MKATRLTLLAVLMMVAAPLAHAKGPVLADPVPQGPPGDWFDSDDYPAVALRFAMKGITAFRLKVDAAGKPSKCDIVESSGFDVLDAATCQRLMANALFSPSRDRAGRPTEGTFSNRVRWVLPDGASPPISERFASMFFTIDQTGRATSCRSVLHVPTLPAVPVEDPCEQALRSQAPLMGLTLRGDFQGPLAEIEFQVADVFTPDLRARVLSPTPGYEQRGLNVHRFTVTDGGKIGQCSYEEQRGADLLATDYCLLASRETFDPPFSAFDKDGVASGWHIMRVLLKTGQ